MKKVLLSIVLTIMVFTITFAADTKSDFDKNLKRFYEAVSIIKKYYVNDSKFETMMNDAIKGMLDGLDVHSTYMTKKQMEDLQRDTNGKYGGVGMVVSIKNNVLTCISPIEDSPSYKLGIKAGDKIVRINGMETSKMTLETAVSKLRGKPGTSVKITIYRDSDKTLKDYTIVRQNIKLKSVKYQLYDHIGYIRITDFKATTAADLKKALSELNKKNAHGFIIDLRGNPGGLLSAAVNVSNLFLPRGTRIVSVKGKNSQVFDLYKAKKKQYTDKPVVILINEGSASAAEIVSGALKDNHRALLVGERSFGKGSVQRLFPLSDGSAIKLTIAKYYTPSDICIHGIGIEPDIVSHERMFTSDESKAINKVKNGKYIEDYIDEMQKQLDGLKRSASTFEKTAEGFNKLNINTYVNNPTNIETLRNKLIANNITISRPLLYLLVNEEIFRIKLGTANKNIIDPVFDTQLQTAISALKSAIWEKEK